MRVHWLHGFLLALAASGTTFATPTPVPDALRDWVPWALEGHESATCPSLAGDNDAHVCLWPGELQLSARDDGASFTGDYFAINGTNVSNQSNPVDNFFNSSRTYLGAPFTGFADVPALSGAPGSMAGFDLDTVNITSQVSVGDTSAVVSAGSTYDIFFLGGFVTSIESLGPDFSNLTKSVVDLDGGEPAFQPRQD